MLPVSLTTCATAPLAPRSGDASGPTKTNSPPDHAYNCFADVSHQNSPTPNPEGATDATSAPLVVFHCVPS